MIFEKKYHLNTELNVVGGREGECGEEMRRREKRESGRIIYQVMSAAK
jgi:hypothetical protein